jgi:hypothetical protein
MKDIINSFKAHLYERTSSPLLGSFIFYWIICNYKLIMVIFDDEMKLNEKFDFIKTIYPQEKITLWNGFDIYYQILLGNGLLIPLIITLIYILLLPFASNFIYGLWIKHQNNFKKISNEKVLTKKEFGDLQRRFTELELSFDDTFSKKDNEIINLKKLIEAKDNNNILMQERVEHLEKEEIKFNEMSFKIKEYEIKLTEKDKIEKELKELKKSEIESKKILLDNLGLIKEVAELKEKLNLFENKSTPKSNLNSILNNEDAIVLKYIGENPQNITSNVAQKLNIHRIKLEKIYQKLLEKEFIKVNASYTSGDKNYRIESKGSDFLLENNLI